MAFSCPTGMGAFRLQPLLVSFYVLYEPHTDYEEAFVSGSSGNYRFDSFPGVAMSKVIGDLCRQVPTPEYL